MTDTTRRITFWVVLTALVAAGIIALTFAPSRAQVTLCFRTDIILGSLADRLGEVPAYRGATSTGNLLVVIVNPETRSWTAVVQSGGGVACVVAAGDGWSVVPPPPPAEEGT